MNEQALAITQHELTQAETAQAMLDDLTIASDADSEFAAELLRDVKARHKFIEGKRKAITAPILKAKKEVDDLFRPVREALEQAERTLKEKIVGYLAQVEAANAAAVQAASTADTGAEAIDALARIEEVQAPQGVNVRYTWDAEIVDPNVIPWGYMVPSLELITNAVRKANGDIKIPGVRIVKRPIVSSRAVR